MPFLSIHHWITYEPELWTEVGNRWAQPYHGPDPFFATRLASQAETSVRNLIMRKEYVGDYIDSVPPIHSGPDTQIPTDAFRNDISFPTLSLAERRAQSRMHVAEVRHKRQPPQNPFLARSQTLEVRKPRPMGEATTHPVLKSFSSSLARPVPESLAHNPVSSTPQSVAPRPTLPVPESVAPRPTLPVPESVTPSATLSPTDPEPLARLDDEVEEMASLVGSSDQVAYRNSLEEEGESEDKTPSVVVRERDLKVDAQLAHLFLVRRMQTSRDLFLPIVRPVGEMKSPDKEVWERAESKSQAQIQELEDEITRLQPSGGSDSDSAESESSDSDSDSDDSSALTAEDMQEKKEEKKAEKKAKKKAKKKAQRLIKRTALRDVLVRARDSRHGNVTDEWLSDTKGPVRRLELDREQTRLLMWALTQWKQSIQAIVALQPSEERDAKVRNYLQIMNSAHFQIQGRLFPSRERLFVSGAYQIQTKLSYWDPLVHDKAQGDSWANIVKRLSQLHLPLRMPSRTHGDVVYSTDLALHLLHALAFWFPTNVPIENLTLDAQDASEPIVRDEIQYMFRFHMSPLCDFGRPFPTLTVDMWAQQHEVRDWMYRRQGVRDVSDDPAKLVRLWLLHCYLQSLVALDTDHPSDPSPRPSPSPNDSLLYRLRQWNRHAVELERLAHVVELWEGDSLCEYSLVGAPRLLTPEKFSSLIRLLERLSLNMESQHHWKQLILDLRAFVERNVLNRYDAFFAPWSQMAPLMQPLVFEFGNTHLVPRCWGHSLTLEVQHLDSIREQLSAWLPENEKHAHAVNLGYLPREWAAWMQKSMRIHVLGERRDLYSQMARLCIDEFLWATQHHVAVLRPWPDLGPAFEFTFTLLQQRVEPARILHAWRDLQLLRALVTTVDYAWRALDRIMTSSIPGGNPQLLGNGWLLSQRWRQVSAKRFPYLDAWKPVSAIHRDKTVPFMHNMLDEPDLPWKANLDAQYVDYILQDTQHMIHMMRHFWVPGLFQGLHDTKVLLDTCVSSTTTRAALVPIEGTHQGFWLNNWTDFMICVLSRGAPSVNFREDARSQYELPLTSLPLDQLLEAFQLYLAKWNAKNVNEPLRIRAATQGWNGGSLSEWMKRDAFTTIRDYMLRPRACVDGKWILHDQSVSTLYGDTRIVQSQRVFALAALDDLFPLGSTEGTNRCFDVYLAVAQDWRETWNQRVASVKLWQPWIDQFAPLQKLTVALGSSEFSMLLQDWKQTQAAPVVGAMSEIRSLVCQVIDCLREDAGKRILGTLNRLDWNTHATLAERVDRMDWERDASQLKMRHAGWLSRLHAEIATILYPVGDMIFSDRVLHLLGQDWSQKHPPYSVPKAPRTPQGLYVSALPPGTFLPPLERTSYAPYRLPETGWPLVHMVNLIEQVRDWGSELWNATTRIWNDAVEAARVHPANQTGPMCSTWYRYRAQAAIQRLENLTWRHVEDTILCPLRNRLWFPGLIPDVPRAPQPEGKWEVPSPQTRKAWFERILEQLWTRPATQAISNLCLGLEAKSRYLERHLLYDYMMQIEWTQVHSVGPHPLQSEVASLLHSQVMLLDSISLPHECEMDDNRLVKAWEWDLNRAWKTQDINVKDQKKVERIRTPVEPLSFCLSSSFVTYSSSDFTKQHPRQRYGKGISRPIHAEWGPRVWNLDDASSSSSSSSLFDSNLGAWLQEERQLEAKRRYAPPIHDRDIPEGRPLRLPSIQHWAMYLEDNKTFGHLLKYIGQEAWSQIADEFAVHVPSRLLESLWLDKVREALLHVPIPSEGSKDPLVAWRYLVPAYLDLLEMRDMGVAWELLERSQSVSLAETRGAWTALDGTLLPDAESPLPQYWHQLGRPDKVRIWSIARAYNNVERILRTPFFQKANDLIPEAICTFQAPIWDRLVTDPFLASLAGDSIHPRKLIRTIQDMKLDIQVLLERQAQWRTLSHLYEKVLQLVDMTKTKLLPAWSHVLDLWMILANHYRSHPSPALHGIESMWEHIQPLAALLGKVKKLFESDDTHFLLDEAAECAAQLLDLVSETPIQALQPQRVLVRHDTWNKEIRPRILRIFKWSWTVYQVLEALVYDLSAFVALPIESSFLSLGLEIQVLKQSQDCNYELRLAHACTSPTMYQRLRMWKKLNLPDDTKTQTLLIPTCVHAARYSPLITRLKESVTALESMQQQKQALHQVPELKFIKEDPDLPEYKPMEREVSYALTRRSVLFPVSNAVLQLMSFLGSGWKGESEKVKSDLLRMFLFLMWGKQGARWIWAKTKFRRLLARVADPSQPFAIAQLAQSSSIDSATLDWIFRPGPVQVDPFEQVLSRITMSSEAGHGPLEVHEAQNWNPHISTQGSCQYWDTSGSNPMQLVFGHVAPTLSQKQGMGALQLNYPYAPLFLYSSASTPSLLPHEDEYDILDPSSWYQRFRLVGTVSKHQHVNHDVAALSDALRSVQNLQQPTVGSVSAPVSVQAMSLGESLLQMVNKEDQEEEIQEEKQVTDPSMVVDFQQEIKEAKEAKEDKTLSLLDPPSPPPPELLAQADNAFVTHLVSESNPSLLNGYICHYARSIRGVPPPSLPRIFFYKYDSVHIPDSEPTCWSPPHLFFSFYQRIWTSQRREPESKCPLDWIAQPNWAKEVGLGIEIAATRPSQHRYRIRVYRTQDDSGQPFTPHELVASVWLERQTRVVNQKEYTSKWVAHDCTSVDQGRHLRTLMTAVAVLVGLDPHNRVWITQNQQDVPLVELKWGYQIVNDGASNRSPDQLERDKELREWDARASCAWISLASAVWATDSLDVHLPEPTASWSLGLRWEVCRFFQGGGAIPLDSCIRLQRLCMTHHDWISYKETPHQWTHLVPNWLDAVPKWRALLEEKKIPPLYRSALGHSLLGETILPHTVSRVAALETKHRAWSRWLWSQVDNMARTWIGVIPELYGHQSFTHPGLFCICLPYLAASAGHLVLEIKQDKEIKSSPSPFIEPLTLTGSRKRKEPSSSHGRAVFSIGSLGRSETLHSPRATFQSIPPRSSHPNLTLFLDSALGDRKRSPCSWILALNRKWEIATPLWKYDCFLVPEYLVQRVVLPNLKAWKEWITYRGRWHQPLLLAFHSSPFQETFTRPGTASGSYALFVLQQFTIQLPFQPSETFVLDTGSSSRAGYYYQDAKTPWDLANLQRIKQGAERATFSSPLLVWFVFKRYRIEQGLVPGRSPWSDEPLPRPLTQYGLGVHEYKSHVSWVGYLATHSPRVIIQVHPLPAMQVTDKESKGSCMEVTDPGLSGASHVRWRVSALDDHPDLGRQTLSGQDWIRILYSLVQVRALFPTRAESDSKLASIDVKSFQGRHLTWQDPALVFLFRWVLPNRYAWMAALSGAPLKPKDPNSHYRILSDSVAHQTLLRVIQESDPATSVFDKWYRDYMDKVAPDLAGAQAELALGTKRQINGAHVALCVEIDKRLKQSDFKTLARNPVAYQPISDYVAIFRRERQSIVPIDAQHLGNLANRAKEAYLLGRLVVPMKKTAPDSNRDVGRKRKHETGADLAEIVEEELLTSQDTSAILGRIHEEWKRGRFERITGRLQAIQDLLHKNAGLVFQWMQLAATQESDPILNPATSPLIRDLCLSLGAQSLTWGELSMVSLVLNMHS